MIHSKTIAGYTYGTSYTSSYTLPRTWQLFWLRGSTEIIFSR
ncbi:hypothetical protein [Pontibacter mucosus]|nr:hypothetical protein [Pontibacter mucosus]